MSSCVSLEIARACVEEATSQGTPVFAVVSYRHDITNDTLYKVCWRIDDFVDVLTSPFAQGDSLQLLYAGGSWVEESHEQS